jgi:hypothetical protein
VKKTKKNKKQTNREDIRPLSATWRHAGWMCGLSHGNRHRFPAQRLVTNYYQTSFMEYSSPL